METLCYGNTMLWKHYTLFKLHQYVHLLQIQYINVFCEMQQLRLRRWNFIT